MRDLRKYMLAVNSFYLGESDTPPGSYCPEDKDGGFRSWLRLTGEQKTDELIAIANSVIYPQDRQVTKTAREEPQLSLF